MTKTVYVKNTPIGGGSRVTIQSMTNTPTADVEKTSRQISRLVAAGCDIVRLAVSSDAEVEACKQYIKDFDVPLVADIQFDHRLAVACSDIGFAKVRINPGNIGGEDGVKRVVQACKANRTAIRVGVNGGSLEGGVIGGGAEALAKSALKSVDKVRSYGFEDIVISVKSSDVRTMIEANRLVSQACDYPLHLGVTESGDVEGGTLKSAIGIGALLAMGIGDTIRVSLSGDPVEEVKAARNILRSVGLDKSFCELISCPTCSRCNYDLEGTVRELRRFTDGISVPLKVAVMGCIVNGPGEAKNADCGVAGGKDRAVLFCKGEIVKTVPQADILPEIKGLISKILAEKNQ
ncbi:MAG: flavodoxin-dependent (E)-4-hydroxy-3-methylbut-2-enyl-diphosphate synthase [Clostridiales bacterium]|nr:flavodoxin-dependent (E)-4-hydroxy-3-methylbut-2-enyl-diphosphate synthase [Clostridiales bacterium]